MSLDISNVTQNLQKVASGANDLARKLSTSFQSASTDVKDFSTALKQDMQMEGAVNTLKGQAAVLGTLLATPFKNAGTSIKQKLSEISGDVKNYFSQLKADMDSQGVSTTLSNRLGNLLTNTIPNGAKNALHDFNMLTTGGTSLSVVTGQLVNYFELLAIALGRTVKSAVVQAQASLVGLIGRAVRPLANALSTASDRVSKFAETLSGKLYTGNKAVKDLNENVKKTGIQFKDVGRIVQGILISKVFYAGLNAIRSATNSVWEFAQQLEYARLVYTNFFGDVRIADNFSQVLQNFAAKTRFTYQELNTAAQQLLAYGFQAKNLMYVLKAVSSAASITGDPAKIESISRALGQIQTKGRLMSEEMRQLAEAGIPAYDILREKLGLTSKQMQNLGKETIPASKAINALVDGINERFGALSEYSNTTMLGMLSNIKDVMLQLSINIFNPIIERAKQVIKTVLTGLVSILNVYKSTGLGGVFEYLVPKGLQGTIRTTISVFVSLFTVIGQFIVSLKQIAGSIGPVLLTWFNMFATTLVSVARILATLTNLITYNAAALKVLSGALLVAIIAWTAYKISVVSAAISAALIKITQRLSKALAVLSGVLTGLAQHPLLLFFMLLAGGLMLATGAFDNVRNSVNKLFGSFNTISSNKILQPKEMKKSTDALDIFSNKLDGTSDAMGKMADGTSKAAKAAKALLNFDEVFNLGPDETTGDDNIASDWQDFLEQLKAGTFNPEDLLKDIKVEDFAQPFVTSLIDSFGKTFSTFGSSVVKAIKKADPGNVILGGLIAIITIACLGFTPVGVFTAFAAVLAGVFWDDLAKAFGLSPTVDVPGLALGAVAASIALYAIGLNPVGLFASVCALLVGGFYDDFKTAFENATNNAVDFEMVVSDAIVALILSAASKAAGSSALEAGMSGVAIVVVQMLLKAIGDELGKDPETSNGAAVTAAAGGIMGFLIAAAAGVATLPVTLLYSAALGLAYLFRDEITDAFNNPTLQATGAIGIATAIGACIGNVPGAVVGFVAGAAYEIVSYFWDDITSVFKEGWDTFTDSVTTIWAGVSSYFVVDGKAWYQIGWDILQGILAGIGGAMATIIDFVAMVIFAPFFQALKQVFGIESPAKEMKPIGQYIMEGIFQGIIDTLVDIVTWVKTNMFDPVVNAIKSIFGINSPAEEMKPLGVSIIEGLLQGIIDTLVGIVTWVQTNIFNPVINAIKSVFGINSPAEETKPLGKNIMAGILQGVIDKLSDIVTWTKQHIFTPMMDALKSVFGIDRDNASELEPTGKSFIKGIFKGISDNITDFVTNIGGFAATVADAFDTWVDGVVGKFTSMMSSISTNISAWVGGLGTTIATGISNAIDAAKGAFSGVVTFVTGGDDKKKMPGHATGGIFSREHVARIAENNRTEAIIPMEDTGAMQPFVDAVSDGIAQSLAPTLLALANSGNGSGVAQNLLVGTLIADDRGLKELERRMNIIKYNENDRRGI